MTKILLVPQKCEMIFGKMSICDRVVALNLYTSVFVLVLWLLFCMASNIVIVIPTVTLFNY